MTAAEKLRFSASRITTWMTCPLQAKFKYVDEVPDERQSAAATVGSAVHKALEHHGAHHDLQAALDIFEDRWTNHEQYGKAIDTWPRGTSFGAYMTKGKDCIRDYHERSGWLKTDFIAAEHKFLVPFGEYELTGFVDLLEFSVDKAGQPIVEITDYKTNGRAPNLANLKLNIQFTVYDYASRQPEFWLGNGPEFPPISVPGPPPLSPAEGWDRAQGCARQGTWYGLMQGRAYDVGERTEADYLRMYRVAREVEKALAHNVFVPNISGDSCGWCPYAMDPCPLPFDPRNQF